MADAPINETTQQPAQPVWSGGMPVARLASDQLPANPKRVIRTFASDLEALQSGAAPMPRTQTAPTSPSAAASTPPPTPRPAPMPSAPRPHATLQEAVSNISMPTESARAPEPPTPAGLPPLHKEGAMYVQRPEAVPPPVPRTAPAPITERFVEERPPSFFSRLFYALFSSRPATPAPPIIAATPSYTPSYVPPPVPAQVTGIEPPIGSQIPSTAAAEEAAEREAVLARLRARVSSYPEKSVTTPETFPTPLPDTQYLRPSATSYGQQSVTGVVTPERLRTFSGDVRSETRNGRESAFSILAAQADAPRAVTQTTTVQTRSNHGLAYALAATVLLVGGSLVLYFTYNYFVARSPVEVIATAPTGTITGDTSTTISGNGSQLMSALSGVAANGVPQGDVALVYLTVGTSTEGGGALVNALQLPAPSILLRNISDASSVGVIHAGDETRVFFILAATSYERTFAGMLSWEPTIGQDLAQLYPSYAITQDPNASTTPAVPLPPRFVDETVANHDVRALKDSQNRTVLLYGFRDQNTLIIARDETAFTTLLARLSASQ
ncbi:MAG TPA: hypothetical protein VHC20_00505 [Candidatus Paceibacterota bacterium]|nr:hypothetical protein [Candidatus Paceibacterota bacterium]